jgi:His-Xaa-Ser system radical SAM maturase HxsB
MDKLLTPFRFRALSNLTLVVNEVADFGFFRPGIESRIYSNTLTFEEQERLRELFILLDDKDDWRFKALSIRAKSRVHRTAQKLSYMLIIPTLRCDLACTYCQVSRASETAKGYDLMHRHLDQLEEFWSQHAARKVKIEFQGGEPTLRSDLVQDIMNRATSFFDEVEFAICTNLINLTPDVEALIADPRMHVSTSIDGPTAVMAKNRTGSNQRAEHFFKNLKYVMDSYGPDKVSALPTIPIDSYDKMSEIIDVYIDLGFKSIFLRPVNYLGFARKNHSASMDDTERWNEVYFRALDRIMEINKTQFFEEYYASMVFQKIIGVSHTNYVDFRSPNRYFEDYCVIDYDGGIYPTDEARMLSRTKSVDLRIGELGGEMRQEVISALNSNSMNEVHPDCIHCTYGPYCGIDLVDDLSRYGRVDLPKHETAFCKRNINLFDLLFSKILDRDRDWLDPMMSWAFRKEGSYAPYEVLYD